MSAPRELIEAAIREGVFPGAAWAYGQVGNVTAGYAGRQTYCPESKAIDSHAVWDLASVSKVVATTSLAIRMLDRGRLDLDRPVAADLPSFGANGKELVTPRNLLRHDAGLIAFRPYHQKFFRRSDVIAAIDAERLVYPTGSKSVYSDLSMIVLARLLSKLDGRPLERMVREDLCEPLGMVTCGYFAPEGETMAHVVPAADAVPTALVEPWRRDLRRATYGNLGARLRYGADPEYIRAEVHDPTATVLGGVAGHAGLFAALDDLIPFAKNLLLTEPKVFSARRRDEFTRRQESKSSRGLGWDTKSPEGSSAGSRFGPRSFGHTGYTGTSIWVDPDSLFFAILLTNRVHPDDGNTKILPFRARFHDAAWEDFRPEVPVLRNAVVQ